VSVYVRQAHAPKGSAGTEQRTENDAAVAAEEQY
jgi:hypothetical protein